MKRTKTHKNMEAAGLWRGALIPAGGVLFTALVIFALFAACQNPVAPAATATGRVTVRFAIEGIPLSPAGNQARTVHPDIEAALPLLAKLELTFTPITGGEPHAPVEVSLENWTANVELTVGTYRITATASANSPDGYLVVAVGSREVQVDPNVNSPVDITLGPKTDGPDGYFSYDITISTEVNSATLTITGQDGTVVETVNLVQGSNVDTIPLAPGYYDLRVFLKKGNDFAGINSEVIHIYSTVTSALPPKTYGDSDFFDVEVVDDLSLDSAFAAPVAGMELDSFFSDAQYYGGIEWSPPIAPGSTFAVSTIYTATVTLTAEVRYTFTGIQANSFTYAGATSVSNQADSGVVTVVFPQTESAIGKAPLDVSLEFAGFEDINVQVYRPGEEISYPYPEDGGILLSLDYPYLIRISDDYTDVEWYVDDQTSASWWDGEAFYLGFAYDYTPKTHRLTVRAKKNDIPYSRILTFGWEEEIGGESSQTP